MAKGSLRRYLASSTGTKVVVGLTGVLLFAFLVVHLAENLLMLIEGALLLARAQHNCDPLRRLKTHLPTLIQSSKGVL